MQLRGQVRSGSDNSTVRQVYGRGTQRNKRDGSMNKLEAKFDAWLATRIGRDDVAFPVAWYKFEGLTFRLAKKTSYTPDFVVMSVDGTLTMYEVKGMWTANARTKVKLAAELFPVRFVGVMWSKGEWKFEEFQP